MSKKKAISIMVATLILVSSLSMAIIYLGSQDHDGGDGWTYRSKPSGNENDLNSAAYGSLGDDVMERWRAYSDGIDSPNVLTLDPGVIKVEYGEELENLAYLEGQSEFSEDGQGTVRGNNTYVEEWLDVDDDGDGMADSAEISAGMDPSDAKDTLDGNGGGTIEEREVEEADLVKLIDDTLFVLNPYRGLITIDVSEPAKAHVAGRCPVIGYPEEMYVVDFLAIITVRTDYQFWYNNWEFTLRDNLEGRRGEPIGEIGAIGTMIYFVDVQDIDSPKILKIVELAGTPAESRRVGHVIYQATNLHGRYHYDEGSDSETIVSSLDFGDPVTLGLKDQVRFTGSSNQVHASQRAFYVVQPEYIYQRSEEKQDLDLLFDNPFEEQYLSYYTNITYLDISDPRGDIIQRDSFKLPGNVNDKYQLDEYKDTFRIVSHFRIGVGKSMLYIVDISEPDSIRGLGSLLIDDNGNLMATRFAGERGYTIHLPRRIDPLDVLDLSDPTDPKLCDVFEMPGWVTHMVVRGMKILALGVDDSEGKRNVAVSLFDVNDPYKVIMKDRVRLGGDYATSTANWEPKALTIDDNHDLLIVPFMTRGDGKTMYGLQLVRFDLYQGDLTLKGCVSSEYSIERTRVIGDYVLSTSSNNFQVSSIVDPEEPFLVKSHDLCVNLVDVVPTDEHYLQLTRNLYDGSIEIRVVDKPDDMEATDSRGFDSNWARLFTINGRTILAFNQNQEQETIGRFYEVSVDREGQLELSSIGRLPYGHWFTTYNNYYYGEYYYLSGYESMDQRFGVTDDALVYYHVGTHPYSSWEYDEVLGRYIRTSEEMGTDKLFILDIGSSETKAKLTYLKVNAFTFRSMQTWEDKVFIEHRSMNIEYPSNSTYWNYKYTYQNYVLEIDCSDTSSPVLMGDHNIPGRMIGAGDGVVYTISSWAGDENVSLNTVSIEDGSSEITSAVKVGTSWMDGIVHDGRAYLVTREQSDHYLYYEDHRSSNEGGTTLRVIDLDNPNNPVSLVSTKLEGDLSIQTIENGHIVLWDQQQRSMTVFETNENPPLVFETMFLCNTNPINLYIIEDSLLVSQGYYGALQVEL